MKVLITGIAGFGGSHLAELALREGAQVVGTVLPNGSTDNLAGFRDAVETLSCDLTEPGAAARVLRGVPVDPAGTPFVLDASNGRVTLDPTSSLNPLPTRERSR